MIKSTVKLFYLASFLITIFSSCSKKSDPAGVTYLDEVYTEINVSTDITYGTAKKDGSDISLKLDVYQPADAQETQRPLIILAHGGSFLQDSKSIDNIVNLSKRFAKRGYVVASIDYRLLNDLNTNITTTFSPKLQLLAGALNAIWDTRASIRFFKKKENIDAYKIDPKKIFIGGFSSGAICALQAAYIKTPEEFDALADGDINMSAIISQYISSNGDVEGNSGNSENESSVLGVINIAGSVISPNIINKGEPIIVSAQAKDDKTVPYTSGPIDKTPIITYGAEPISKRATEEGITNLLIPIEKGDHYAFFQCEPCKDEVTKFVYDNIK